VFVSARGHPLHINTKGFGMSEPISVMGALIDAHRLLFKLGCDPTFDMEM